MIELVRPTTLLADSWWQMVDAFGDEQIHGSGLHPTDRPRRDDPGALEAWVDWLGLQEVPGDHIPEGRVPASHRWIVEDGRVVGTIALRHVLNDALVDSGGHVGYAIAPGSRRRGLASAALARVLAMAAGRGIGRVLVTCDVGNVASACTIERAGGRLEDERAGVRRYWVPTVPMQRDGSVAVGTP
jgi:predicted acetyltransferase